MFIQASTNTRIRVGLRILMGKYQKKDCCWGCRPFSPSFHIFTLLTFPKSKNGKCHQQDLENNLEREACKKDFISKAGRAGGGGGGSCGNNNSTKEHYIIIIKEHLHHAQQGQTVIPQQGQTEILHPVWPGW